MEYELEKYIKNCKFYVWKETFAIIKSKKALPGAFANIVDKNEITVVVDQSKYNKKDALEIERNWKIISFDITLPFELVGFLAEISRVLAQKKISIFVISAFSTDHILVKEKDLRRAKEELRKIGCIEEKN